MLWLQRLPASRRTHLSLIRLSSPFFIFHDFLALVARDVIFLRGPIRRWKIADAAEGNECFIEVSAASIHSNDLVRHFHTRRPFPDKKKFPFRPLCLQFPVRLTLILFFIDEANWLFD